MKVHKIDAETMRALAMASDLRILIGQLKRRLRAEATLGDFTPSQVAVLRRIGEDGPATVTALARAEGVRSQSMGATVAALEAAGMVSGSPDPNDGRQTILSLTAACRKKVLAGRAAHEDWLFRTIQSKLTLKEQGELAHAVELLKRVAG